MSIVTELKQAMKTETEMYAGKRIEGGYYLNDMEKAGVLNLIKAPMRPQEIQDAMNDVQKLLVDLEAKMTIETKPTDFSDPKRAALVSDRMFLEELHGKLKDKLYSK